MLRARRDTSFLHGGVVPHVQVIVPPVGVVADFKVVRSAEGDEVAGLQFEGGVDVHRDDVVDFDPSRLPAGNAGRLQLHVELTHTPPVAVAPYPEEPVLEGAGQSHGGPSNCFAARRSLYHCGAPPVMWRAIFGQAHL